MPELPEVETTRRGIEPHILNSKIEKVIVRNGRLRWPVPDDIADLLQGHSISEIIRRAKYLLLKIESEHLLLHLGMSGTLRIVSNDLPPEKHDHIDILFSNGKVLRFNDPRRFGACLWVEDIEEHELLNHLGPEPLTEQFNGQRLIDMSRKKTQAVKTFIMDNKVVVGVGNIYANEALFNAGVHPLKKAGKVTKKQYELLASEIKKVLAKAIEQGGTTLKDFVGGDGKPGYFAQSLNVYGRGGEPCVTCSKPLTESRIGQRTTVYCTDCQS